MSNFRLPRYNGEGWAWLNELRNAAIERFASVGYPDLREDEHWRWTQLGALPQTAFRPAQRAEISPDVIAPYSFGTEAAVELVFVNGFYAPGLSKIDALPRGARVVNWQSAGAADEDLIQRHLGRYSKVEDNPFVALNTGSAQDGVLIHLARGVALDRPVHVLHVNTGGADPVVTHPRMLIVLEENAEAQVAHTYAGAGEGTYFTNTVSEVVVGDSARLEYCKLQHESLSAYHIGTTQAQVGRSGVFVSHQASLGSLVTRNDVNAVMAGDGAEATLNGLTIIGGRQHVDNHTLLDHAQPNCPTHELYKAVLDGHSSSVFKGQILVRPGSLNTDSKQTSRTLLLADTASMNAQPALEIYADDVKCTHGSTTGPLDEEQVFYLQSRGLHLEAARHLLTYAFAADITGRIRTQPVRRYLEEYMAAQHGLPKDLRIQ